MNHRFIEIVRGLTRFVSLHCLSLLAIATTFFLPTLLSLKIDESIFEVEDTTYAQLEFAFGCSLAVTFPLFMGISLDYMSFPDALFLHHRILSTLVLAISNGIILIYFNSHQAEMIMLTCFMWSYFLEFMIILSTFHTLSDLPPSCLLTSSRLLSFFTLYVFFFCAILCETVEYTGGVFEKIAIASFVLFTCIHFCKTFIVFRNHYQLYAESKMSVFEWYSSVDDRQIFLQIRLVGFLIQLIVLYLVFFAVGSPTNTSNGLFHADDIFHLVIVRTFFFLIEYFVSARIFRSKLIRSNQDLAFKTQLIKYFSHEMRSPIMVMTVGLELIANSIKLLRTKSAASEISVIEDNLSDVRSSCEQSLEILDSMLLYEKIENDIVVPNLMSVEPLKGIRDLLKVYESAAKSMQVSIFLQYSEEEFTRNKKKLMVDNLKLRHVFSAILSSIFKKVGMKSNISSLSQGMGPPFNSDVVRNSQSLVNEMASDLVECVVNRSSSRSHSLSINDVCFRAFIDADIDSYQSVLKSRLKRRLDCERNVYGNTFFPSWLHIEMRDVYGNISDDDIAEMNSQTLDFTRKGYDLLISKSLEFSPF